MSGPDLERVDPETLLNWPRPRVLQLEKPVRKIYVAQHRALASYMSGNSLLGAATRYKVNRGTLARIVGLSKELDPSGAPWGFRACVPYFRGTAEPNLDAPADQPIAAAPHSFGQLLRSNADVRELVLKFQGKLPSGRKRSTQFDRLFSQIKKKLQGAEHLYPMNTPDKGRRALLEYLKRQRQRAGAAVIGEAAPPTPAIERLDQLFTLQPFQRTEYDAHEEDIDWYIEVPTPDGGWTVRKVGKIWFLFQIDVVTRNPVGWTLVIAKGYRQFDVMEMLAKGMVPWEPGVLTTPDLCYISGCGMPSTVTPDGTAPRSIFTAGDNYSAHQAHHIRHNLLFVHLGVWNWAQAHIPEKRPIIEAFFHLIEQGALRGIAGGYVPASRRGDTPTPVSGLDPKKHPLNVVALFELMDVVITAYAASSHRGLHDRSPLQTLSDYINRGGWIWQSSLSERHAAEMSKLWIEVTIRGSRRESRQPYVEWKGGR